MEQERTPLTHPEVPKGVGGTALFVAIARDEARKLPHPPFSDPYARLLAAPLYDAKTDTYPLLNNIASLVGTPLGFVTSTAIRTMWYDHQVNIAIQQGIKQFVNLGAGMDTRAFRFNYAEGSHYYEVDFPAVLDYKNSVLEKAGVQPKCARHCLTADVTQKGWIERLKENGFNPQEVTLWFLEGLTMYLEEKENKFVLSEALESSAVGSRVLVLTITAEKVAEYRKPDSLFMTHNIEMKYGTSDPGAFISSCGWTVGEVLNYQETCARFNRQDLFDPDRTGMHFALGHKK